MKVAVVTGLSDDKARGEIIPIASLPEVEEVYLVRRYPLSMPKVTTYAPPVTIRGSLLLSELYRVLTILYLSLFKKPDVYIGIYFTLHGVYAGIAGKIFNKPVIQLLIGTDRPKVEASKFYLQLLGSADYVGVRGNTSRKRLVELGIGPERIFIPTGVNALDFERFKPSSKEKHFDLVYVGRIDNNKQVRKIIQAVARVFPSCPDIKLSIVGDGPERAHMERLIASLGLNDAVTFHGSQLYTEIPKFLNDARIFIMASDFEGLPVAMLEAICCGLPVIVPNAGDITDVAVHGVNAFVVDPPSVDGFAYAISSLLTNPHLNDRLAQGALRTREQLVVEYSFDRSMEIWRSVLL